MSPTLTRDHLTVLLNAFYELDERRIPVEHPADEFGTLCTLELNDPQNSSVSVDMGAGTYEECLGEVGLNQGENVRADLPNSSAYVRMFVASGLADIENRDEVDRFVDQHGYRDLEEGFPPLYAGFDTNLLPWRMHEALEIDPEQYADDHDRVPVNGYALPVGVDEELSVSYRYGDESMPATALADALGPEFERLAGQPAGNDRETRLGLREFRRLSQSRPHDIVASERGDAAIIQGCAEYYEDEPTEVLLFSNDYGFVDRANTVDGVRGIHVSFPVDLPRRLTGNWRELANLLYVFAVVFGVVVLPKVTLYGVWDEKRPRHWHREALFVKPRSDQVAELLARDKPIVKAHSSL